MSITRLTKTFKGKKVLITGHTGFKGSWLSIWLKTLGSEVSGLSIDIPTTPSHFDTAKIFDIIDDRRVDVRDYASVEESLNHIKPDFIFHLAAQPLVKKSYTHTIETWQTNTFGTINLLESLKSFQHKCVVIFITSDKCYDNVEWPWGYKETDALGGPDPYSGSKGAAELAIKSYTHSFFNKNDNIRIGIGRAGNVIGGGDWALDRIVPDSVRAWSIGNYVELRNPNSTRPWQHVLEPLSGYLNLAIELANSNELHGEPFNFGPPTNQNYSVGVLVDEMSKYWDKVKWRDLSSSYVGPYESGLLKLNCDKALHYLKWSAIWDFEKTIKETSLWYRNYYNNSQNIREFTIEQILMYMEDASKNGLKWAI